MGNRQWEGVDGQSTVRGSQWAIDSERELMGNRQWEGVDGQSTVGGS